MHRESGIENATHVRDVIFPHEQHSSAFFLATLLQWGFIPRVGEEEQDRRMGFQNVDIRIVPVDAQK